MNRIDLPEIEDQPWCPRWLRWIQTAYLREVIRITHAYDASAPVISESLRRSNTGEIVDLCSGAGGPWPHLIEQVETAFGKPVTVTLTDLYPQGDGDVAGDERVTYYPDPVSAESVPAELGGARTMFTAIHHFDPSEVAHILSSAQRDRVGFTAFEATQRSLKGVLVTLLIPLMVWLIVPKVRPVRWHVLLFTYLIPVVPLAIWWDGLASTLRSYTADELHSLISQLPDSHYSWTVGERMVERQPIPMLQVIGRPE